MILPNGKPFNPGELRTRITLLRPSVSVETGGFTVPGYETDGEVWTRWQNAHGAEVWAAQAVQAVAPATVLMRYRAEIDTTWRVQLGEAVYEIVSLDNLFQRGELLELKVRRVVNG